MKFRKLLSKIYRLNLHSLFTRFGLDQALRQNFSDIKPVEHIKIEGNFHGPDRTFDEPVKYIHIGYPKAASTAIQNGFLGKHPQILNLGCGTRVKKDYWDDHGYISSAINLAVEIDLRFRIQLAYDARHTKEVFEPFFKQAKDDKKIYAVGLSNENFSFNWHRGIDTIEKAKRLLGIFGENTKIIMVLRNQKDLVESLYKESIRFGYRGEFKDYLKYLWQYKDRNFYFDFHFDKIFDLYAGLFGQENVHILFFEDFRNAQTEFLEAFCKILRVDSLIIAVPQEYNKQLSDKELYIKRQLNQRFSHTFEKGFYSPFDTHRYVPYYRDELNQDVEFEDYLDYHLRNDFCLLSQKLASKVDMKPIELNWKNQFGTDILNGFSKSNQRFYSNTKAIQLKKYKYLDLI